MFPCAWPGCENGIAEDHFQDCIKPIKSDPTVYTRREWVSPLGGSYYSWDSSDLPNWFNVSQTFWNEARRHRLVADSFPEIVYHYTSLEGFFGIVENKSIWLSDYSYLNDRRELKYGADIAKNAIAQLAKTEPDPNPRELFSDWIEKLEVLENRICMASFSSEDDSLSQWRAYGPIAIGFDTRALSLHVDQSRLQPVEYNPEVQKKLIEILVYHLKSAYLVDTTEGRLDRIPDAYHKVYLILELIAFFKDPAFKSENEYRLVYIDIPEVLDSIGLERPPKSFRISKGRIVPYVPSVDILPSEYRDYKLELKEIVLGPESDELLEKGVREFLDENGLTDVISRRSLIPLRS